MAPLSTDTDASALQLHLKDPESSLSRPRTISDSPPLSPQGILSHTFSQDPTNPTIAGVSGISKVFVGVGFLLLTRRCYKPDDKGGPSSGGGVGLSGRLDKPDANRRLKSRIGTGLLALGVGFVGLG